jgi:O-antigen/teichoic acid export membrane protein
MKPISSEMTDQASPDMPDVSVPELNLEFTRNMGQISRQSMVFFAGTLFTMGAGYLAKIYVARVLGAEQLGLYALGMTLASLVQLFGIVGLQSTAARYVSVYSATGRYDELRGFLTRSVGIVILLNLIFCLGLQLGGSWISQHLYHAPRLAQYIPFFVVLAFLGSLNVFYCQILGGFKDVSRRTLITNFVGSALVIVLTVGLLAAGTGMPGYLIAQIINSIIVVALLVRLAGRLTPKEARFSWRPLPRIDPEIKAFTVAAFGMSILDFLVSQADKILLGFFLNAALVGVYVVASTLSALIPIILQSVNQIFSPVIAHLHAEGRHDVLGQLFQTLTKWVLGLTLPLASVVIIFALPLMRIFGPGFESGWKVLVIGTVGQVVNCGVGSVGYILLMSGNQRRLIRVQFAMAAISILVNVVLIPPLGIVGAALASATVNVAGNLWNLYHVRQALQIFPYNRSYYALVAPAAISALAALGLRWLANWVAYPWMLIVAALIVSYLVFAGLAVVWALDPYDRMIARSAWRYFRNSVDRWRVQAS